MLRKIIGSTLLLSLVASSAVSAQTIQFRDGKPVVAPTTQGTSGLSSSQQAWQREREARLIRQANWERARTQGQATPGITTTTGLTDLEIANKRAAEQAARDKVVAANRAARQKYELQRAAEVTAARAAVLAQNEAARQKYERDQAGIAEDRAMAARYEREKQAIAEQQERERANDAAKMKLWNDRNLSPNSTNNGIMVEGASGQRTPGTTNGEFDGNQVSY